jgi:hypothetical protein
MGVQVNEDNDEEVPQDGDKVHGKEQNVEKALVLWPDGKAHKEEI